MPRNLTRILLALIIIGLILPASFIASSWLKGRPTTQPRERQYSTANIIEPSSADIQAVLAKLSQTLNPKDLVHLRIELKGITGLTVHASDPLGDYFSALSNFVDKMAEIKDKLEAAKASLASGNRIQAILYLNELNSLRDRTKPLLASLYTLIDRVASQYGIDMGTQLQKIRELDALFQTYSEQIDQLNAQVRTQSGFTRTILTLNASRTNVYVEESFFVYGFLKDENGTALLGRNVTISWGINQTTLTVTDFIGRFQANISFPIGTSAGPAQIGAEFRPEGGDSKVYMSSNALLRVEVTYQPSVIDAAISPTNVRPFDFVDVRGNLSAVGGKPLEFKTLMISLDGAFLANARTTAIGAFTFGFFVPETLNNGTHTVEVIFPATGERYAPSNVTLSLTVERPETVTRITVNRTSLLSGMGLFVNGTVAYRNGTAVGGRNVTVYFDGMPYMNVTLRDDGSFASTIPLPLLLPVGTHFFRVSYVPNEPWVIGSQSTIRVFVFNTPFLILIIGVVSTASLLGGYVTRRRRVAPMLVTVPQPVRAKTKAEEEIPIEREIAAIENEKDNAAKIRKTFHLAQAILEQETGEAQRDSETHWEYFSRVSETRPQIKEALNRLVNLFELAEYSPYPLGTSQSEEAMQVLRKLREEV